MYQTQTLLKLTNNCHSKCEERDKLKSDISLVSNHSAMTLKLSNSALIYKRDLSCQIFLLARENLVTLSSKNWCEKWFWA